MNGLIVSVCGAAEYVGRVRGKREVTDTMTVRTKRGKLRPRFLKLK
jgi:hypothetical protein